MGEREHKDWHIAIFASGTGSNAVKIMEYLSERYKMRYSIYSNKPNAGVLEKAKALGVEARVFGREEFKDPQGVGKELQENKVDLVVLAGFLWLVPSHMVARFEHRMINIHPSLLPKYGGKGMYGARVHTAVKEAQDQETGITIHYVNELYDEGDIILQEKVAIGREDSIEDIAKKVQVLEHLHFPRVVEQLLLEK